MIRSKAISRQAASCEKCIGTRHPDVTGPLFDIQSAEVVRGSEIVHMCEGSSIVRRVPYQDYDTTRAVVVEAGLARCLEREVRERLLLGRTWAENIDERAWFHASARGGAARGRHQEKEESDDVLSVHSGCLHKVVRWILANESRE